MVSSENEAVMNVSFGKSEFCRFKGTVLAVVRRNCKTRARARAHAHTHTHTHTNINLEWPIPGRHSSCSV
jgi:hypothetical protein